MSSNDYKFHLQVLSHHCDATGIVQYPRYAEMAHMVVENWFDEALDWSFARMVGRDNAGVPVVATQSDYPTASRIGDNLVWTLSVTQVGRSSVDLALIATCGAERRVSLRMTLVHSDIGVIRPRIWPAPVRARMADYLDEKAMAAQ